MKKIMFNDKYGLTEAVLSGRKTQTRRLVPKKFFTGRYFRDGEPLIWQDCDGDWRDIRETAWAFKVGEIVAIAQSYKDAGVASLPEEDDEFGCYDFPAEQTNGWNNKMFVRADLMPHQIRITNVHVERLQDISDEDCLKEGILINNVYDDYPEEHVLLKQEYYVDYLTKKGHAERRINFDTPCEVYACLIDKISGKGTFERNPYVFVYDFELVK